ncbi:MAG: hypothetical protein HY033_05545 [Ignavibacteriae bacterium]|nr:hypothetical protein [Ignavibacteria bacterium]MBI3364353.1 hypothetical protein [Ignavibacteriota bacterium]
MNTYLKWFQRVVWVGIVVNLLFALPALLAPDVVLASLGLSGDFTTEWLRDSGMLVLSISLFYIPVAIEPIRFALYAWILIAARFIAGIFWIDVIMTSTHPAAFRPMLLTDLPLGIILAFLLSRGLPEEKKLHWQSIKKILLMPIDFFKMKWRSTAFRIVSTAVLLTVILVGFQLWNNLLRARPDIVYDSDEEQFKYGAIGLGIEGRIPYYIFKILPDLFTDKLPGPGGWASFGLVFEQGKDLPVGLSRRHIGFPSVEPNCAFCHTGSYKLSPAGERKLMLGSPAHELDLEAFQWFLYDCADDPRFNPDTILARIDKIADLSWAERLTYKYIIIPFAKHTLQQQRLAYAWQQERPLQGKGRTDTFNPTKIDVFHFPDDHTIGTVDLPQIWNQKKREGMWLHWDGNNNNIRERNYAAAMAIGATSKSVIPANFKRVTDFLLGLLPPKFPAEIDRQKADSGKAVFERACAGCHAFGSEKVGTVTPIEDIDTDPYRLFSFTEQTVERFHQIDDPPFKFDAYRKTYGYCNTPLDGMWARAPYLHNGSVPTMWDLLQPVEARPTVFYKGYNVYDPVKLGFVNSGPDAERVGFKILTGAPGNSNRGHTFGTTFSDREKWNLIEFLKTQ